MCISGAYRILNDAQEPCAGLDTGAVTMYSIVVGPLGSTSLLTNRAGVVQSRQYYHPRARPEPDEGARTGMAPSAT